jgi:aspartate aminotransferase-like enzyme
LFAEEGYRSPTVTAVTNTRGIDVDALNAFLTERGMTISNGYGKLKGKTFRIAHMGDVTRDEMQALLDAIDEFLAATS